MNLQAYADHRKAQGLRGQSHVAVLKAIESGRLTAPAVSKVNGRWVIDPALADAQWHGNTDHVYEPKPQTALLLNKTKKNDLVSGGPTIAEARRARMVYQAERERLMLLREKEELLPAEQVKREAFNLAKSIREALLNIPDRVSNQFAAETDPQAVHLLLTGEISQALEQLANG